MTDDNALMDVYGISCLALRDSDFSRLHSHAKTMRQTARSPRRLLMVQPHGDLLCPRTPDLAAGFPDPTTLYRPRGLACFCSSTRQYAL